MNTFPALVLVCLVVTALGLPSTASAGELHGVDMPDTMEVGEHSLVLNGMGLRKKAFIKVYVAGLYLADKSSDPESILGTDSPRRIVMSFTFSVGAEKMCDAWKEGLENNTPSATASLEAKFESLCEFMDDLQKGDALVATYLPGTGTEIESRGSLKGTFAGKEFADALFACWLGPEPPGEDLKRGLLGS